MTAAHETIYIAQAMHAWTTAMEPFFVLFGDAPPMDEARLLEARVRAPFGLTDFLNLTVPPSCARLHQDLWNALVSARSAVHATRGIVCTPALLADTYEDLQIVAIELARHVGERDAAPPDRA